MHRALNSAKRPAVASIVIKPKIRIKAGSAMSARAATARRAGTAFAPSTTPKRAFRLLALTPKRHARHVTPMRNTKAFRQLAIHVINSKTFIKAAMARNATPVISLSNGRQSVSITRKLRNFRSEDGTQTSAVTVAIPATSTRTNSEPPASPVIRKMTLIRGSLALTASNATTRMAGG